MTMRMTLEPTPALADPAPVDSDLALLRRYSESSDQEAFAEIVRRYAGVVYGTCMRILRDDARAHDICQETFFRLVQKPYAVTQSLGGWLHRSAIHLALDAKRSDTARQRRERDYGLKTAGLSDSGLFRARAESPKWEDVSPYVDAALVELPDSTRQLLVRHFLQGVPQATLAEELATSPATISRRMKSGVEAIQALLRKKGIYVGLAVLAEALPREAARATPVTLLHELGKMTMVGGTPPNPAPFHPPNPFKLRPGSGPAPASTVKLAWCSAGLAGVVLALGVILPQWATRATPPPVAQNGDVTTTADRPAPKASPAPLNTNRVSPELDGKYVYIQLGKNLDTNLVGAFEQIGKGPDARVTVVYNDTHVSTDLTVAQARKLIEGQTGKTLEDLAKDNPSPPPN